MTPGFEASPPVAALAAAAVAMAAAVLGLQLSGAPRAARRLIPFSAGLLAGIAAFGVLPELAERHGRAGGVLLLAFGFLLLWAVGRWVYAVCPACSHTHDHSMCAASLHGFALPLVAAASLHAFLDGLSIAASQQEHSGRLAAVVLLGVGLHKIPEGVALGVMLRAALGSGRAALAWCAAVQAATVAGAALESAAVPRMGVLWVSYALGLAGGSFLYLAYHAVHAEWRTRGVLPAFAPALTGVAGAAALQHGLHAWLG